MHLSRSSFFIDHVDGSSNALADILMWCSRGCGNITIQTERIATLYADIVPESSTMALLGLEEIIAEQRRFAYLPFVGEDELPLLLNDGRILVPSYLVELNL